MSRRRPLFVLCWTETYRLINLHKNYGIDEAGKARNPEVADQVGKGTAKTGGEFTIGGHPIADSIKGGEGVLKEKRSVRDGQGGF